MAIVLLALIAVLIGATLYLYMELRNTKTDMAAQFQTMSEQIAQLEGSVNRTSRVVDTSVQEVRGMVQEAESKIDQKASQVEQRVLGRTTSLAKEIEQTKTQHQQALAEVGGKITELNQVASQTDSKVGALSGRVDTVKTELTEAQAELEKAVADLKTVRGDLGVQSGLIATNSGELEALKRLGQRNYFEFSIRKTKEPQKVGRIQLRLRDTNDKKGLYTLEVMADDKTIEKKNKSLLEPVQFYVIGSKIPYEIVVNKMEKNHISGYLATPLDDEPRRAANDKP
ncbi:MAG: hypothetical protein GC160_01240 [Acidobacteria bacterium]|nr:hypothetical protein [Acidobacteriota bacterium]